MARGGREEGKRRAARTLQQVQCDLGRGGRGCQAGASQRKERSLPDPISQAFPEEVTD